MSDFESSPETCFQNGDYNSKLSQKFAYFQLFSFRSGILGELKWQISVREEKEAAGLASALACSII